MSRVPRRLQVEERSKESHGHARRPQGTPVRRLRICNCPPVSAQGSPTRPHRRYDALSFRRVRLSRDQVAEPTVSPTDAHAGKGAPVRVVWAELLPRQEHEAPHVTT